MKIKNKEKETMQIIEDVFGCKWTIRIIAEIRVGNRRPGAIRRALDGLSEKVLNERLQKLIDYRMIERNQISEKPLAVEYALTSFGKRFLPVLDAVKQAAD